jgi:hypothetical protein
LLFIKKFESLVFQGKSPFFHSLPQNPALQPPQGAKWCAKVTKIIHATLSKKAKKEPHGKPQGPGSIYKILFYTLK